jgi:hypothetical protein
MDIAPDGSPRTLRTRLALAFLVTATGLLLSVAASVLYDGVKDCAGQQFAQSFANCVSEPSGLLSRLGLTAVLGLLCFWLSLLAIPVAQRALVRSSARMHQKRGKKPKFPGVIFALSVLNRYEHNGDGLPRRDGETSPVTKATAAAIDEVANVHDNSPEAQIAVLNVLCDRKGPCAGWPWQQPLRVLRHNHANLRVFCAILSEEAEAQFSLFRKIVEPLLPPGVEMIRVASTAGRDNYNDLTGALADGINMLHQKLACSLADLCVDTTSGTAIYSAAATVTTLNSGVKLCYIATFGGDDEGEIMIFDASLAG